ncbi:MAG: D-2-hydroxyacid dehydrogenase [Pseudomonadota bacterium]
MSDTPRILLHNSETARFAQALTSRFQDIEFCECKSYEALLKAVADFRPDIVYSVRFAGTPAFPREALFAPNGPVWVANGGAGTDHFGHWDTARVTVTNAAGVAADMMAEYVIGGFLHFTLDVPGLLADKAAHRWQTRTVRPLSGGTLLVIGLGHTGQAIATRAKAFGMHVIGTRARPVAMDGVAEVHAADALPGLLPRADFIAVATPLTPQTHGLLGPAEFRAIKPGAVIADVSRGGVVDQSALIAALTDGTVAGAALDVFETEPLPQDNPLWQMDTVLISPHCSSVYEGWEQASFELFLANLQRWMTGETLTNVVDPSRGY